MARKKKSFSSTLVRKFYTLTKRLITLGIVLMLGALGGFFLQGKVVKVHDGDTISILTTSGLEKIRLYGIDCPESQQQGGSEATAFAKKTVFLRQVAVQAMHTDTYGRTVGIVRLQDNSTLNELLVENGHAWVYGRYCKSPVCLKWKISEKKARQERKGLWASKRATPPWRWRDNQRR